MTCKLQKQNMLSPKGLNRIQLQVSQFGLLKKWRKNEGVNNYPGAPRRNCYILDKKVLTSISFDLIQTQLRLFLTLIQILVIAWLCEKWWACTLFTELLFSSRPFLTASQVNQFWNCWLTRGIPLDTSPSPVTIRMDDICLVTFETTSES